MGNCNELAVGYADMTPTKRMLWRRSLVDLYAYWEGLEVPPSNQENADAQVLSSQSKERLDHARALRE